MFDFLNKKNDISNKQETFIEIASLLIHASKIYEDFTEKEKDIIKKTLLTLGAQENELDQIMSKAREFENDSNQILNFTQKVKNAEYKTKIEIVKALWKIIYSDNQSDMYETNLMRRLTGLLYLSSKDVGDIKEEIKKEK